MEEFLRRALHVEEVDEEIDLDSAPSSGQEYLRRVMLEAKNCDAVVVANIDKKKLKAQTDSGCVPAPDGFAPTREWQVKQVAAFSDLRSKLAQQAELAKKQGATPKLDYDLPDIEDEQKWSEFLYGNESRPGIPPLLSLIQSMNQYTVENLLEYNVQWLKKNPFTDNRGRWIYALLAKLEKPLKPEMGSLIRNLARSCAAQRAKLPSAEDPLLSQLNLFICLAGRYFDQSDLADP